MNPVISGEPSSSSNPTYTTFILTIALVPLVLWINKFGKNIVQSTSMAAGLASSEKDPSGDFKGDIKVTTRLPSKEDVERVAELPVFDRDGGKHTFKSLYADNENGPRRVLIIFIRHFFCGQCQEYLRSFASTFGPSTLSPLMPPTSVIVIGCGQPDLIPMYIKETSCPYPIYADPTRALYHHLGMTSTLSLGPAPKYAQTSVFSLVVRSALLELRAGRRMLSGGDYRQVGGEFLFEGGKVVWCHRMRNTRDHAEMDVVKRQLGLDGDRDQEEKAPQRKRWSVAGFGGGSAVVGAGGGLGRRSSQRRQSWRQSWAGERSRSRNRTDPSRMGMVEEGGEKVNGEATVDASGQDVGVNGEGAVSDAMTNGTTKGTSTNGHSIS